MARNSRPATKPVSVPVSRDTANRKGRYPSTMVLPRVMQAAAEVVGGRAADGHAVDGQSLAVFEGDHHQHGGEAPQQTEQQRRQIAGKYAAQQTAGRQDGQRGDGTQLIEGEHGDDVGKTQLYAGQRHDKCHGKQVFQCAQTQRQCRQHGAQGDGTGIQLHGAPPNPAPRPRRTRRFPAR